MKGFPYFFVVLFFLLFTTFSQATNFSKFKKPQSVKQLGLGMGVTMADPLSPSVNSLVAALEGTYRYQQFGVSLLAALTSSNSSAGGYWFNSTYSAQHTYLEPRFYWKLFHIGPTLGVAFYTDANDQMQALPSYGGDVGFELPMGSLSLGADFRYVLTSWTSNDDPFSVMFMLRLKL